MRRLRVKRLMLCLLLGVVATVLSAWGLGFKNRRSVGLYSDLYGVGTAGAAQTYFAHHRAFGFHSFTTISGPSDFGLDVGVKHAPPEKLMPAWVGEDFLVRDLPVDTIESETWVASGWPRVSMVYLNGMSMDFVPGTVTTPRQSWRWSLKIDSILGQTGRLPLRPLWPGFLISTLVYASACWLLLATPGGVRRWRRKQRGLCSLCGYDLSGLETCPECGETAERSKGTKGARSP